jgi:enamine deaminase RidA (YjgF/YER057c/UK114 family)
MQHIVHMQLYLENLSDFAAVDQVYATYFPHQFPSRVLLGVTKMPTDTTIEMTAVVVRDLKQKKILNLKSLKPLGNASSAVQVGSRIYLSGVYGNTSGEVEANLRKALSEIKLKTANVVWRNDYGTSIAIRELPMQAKFAASVIASNQSILKIKNNICRSEGQTIYCTAQSGNESGAKSVEEQVKSVMQKLAAGLAAFGSNFSAVTASNVYLDDIKEFKLMNDTYATFFTNAPPTRTTVQPFPTARQALVKISVIAVK